MNRIFLTLSLLMGVVVLTSNYLVQFPNAVEGTLYSYNSVYEEETNLENGRGYWIYIENNTANIITFNESTLSLESILNIDMNIELDEDLSNDNYFISGDFNLSEFDNIPIHITKEYKQPKRELDKWKECGLKSLFLLKELDRLGATKYDNLAPIMDMIQDIQLPDHSELDKDIAGVPSAFTNLT